MVIEGTYFSPIHLWSKSKRQKKNFNNHTFMERCSIYYLLRTDEKYKNVPMEDIKVSYSDLRSEAKKAAEKTTGVTWWDRAVEAHKNWKGI